MNDNELLEALVLATLARQGMESTPHGIVRHARQCLNEVRKAQHQLAGETFAAADKQKVYDN